MAAYDAPFPSERHFAGARQFPWLVPLDITDPPASMLTRAWTGALGRDHLTVPGAGHFLQEQQPDLLVDAILRLG